MPKKILLVDDEEDIIETLTKRLRSRGYDVSAAANGREALESIRRDRPDLIILDMMMPVMDGRQLSQVLRQNSSTGSIPIIYLTALQKKEDEVSCGNSIAGQIIFAKPFDAYFLLSQVENLLTRP